MWTTPPPVAPAPPPLPEKPVADASMSPRTLPDPSPPSAIHKRRVGVLAILWCLACAAIVTRVVDIQVLRRDRFTARAAGQHERQIMLEARRGRIVDRDGVDLAMSLPAASVAINPRKAPRASSLAERISEITGEPAPSIHRRIHRPDRSFAWISRNVEPATAARLQELAPDAVMLLSGTRRVHPLGFLAGQVLGHVDIDNNGGGAIERTLEDQLRGNDGWVRTLVDARGDRVPNTASPIQPALDGHDATLTIDADYQAIVEHELALAVEATEATGGVAVLYDASTGAIRAMANVPVYNPDEYRTTDAAVRRNRAITDPFEPGSTFKLVAASAALAEGVVTPSDSIDCLQGRIEIAGDTISDSHPNGMLAFSEVISHSSNVGTIIVSQRLESDTFYRYIRRFGFGAETGIAMPGESKGILAPTSHWSGRSHATIAIGQEIGVTALQIAAAYGALANDGWLMQPHLIASTTSTGNNTAQITEPVRVRRVVSAEVARTMVDLLCGVVEDGTGTTARIAGLRVAGKTGTAQIARSDGRGYERGAYTASFAGFLPDMDPRLVCVVSVARPKTHYYGSTVAGPVFRRIMNRILSRDVTIVRSARDDSAAVMPNLVGGSTTDALQVLASLDTYARYVGDGGTIVGQWPPPSARVPAEGGVELILAERDLTGRLVPDVRGMTVRQAVALLHAGGMRVELDGTGVVRSQQPYPGSSAPRSGVVHLQGREWNWTAAARSAR